MNEARLLAGLLLVGGAGCHQRGQPAYNVAAVDAQPALRAAHNVPDAAPVVANQAAPPDTGADSGRPISPIEQAMTRLVTAVLAKDPAGVLACFSRRKPISFISQTPDGKISKLKFTYEAVEKGMKPKGDFWHFFFDDDEFFGAIEDNPHWVHVKHGMFVPPGHEQDPNMSTTAIRWRREGEAYVIDALFDNGG